MSQTTIFMLYTNKLQLLKQIDVMTSTAYQSIFILLSVVMEMAIHKGNWTAGNNNNNKIIALYSCNIIISHVQNKLVMKIQFVFCCRNI